MRKLITIAALFTLVGTVAATEVVVKGVKGTVEARSGVSEEWIAVKAGQVLTSDNTLRTGKKASVVLVAGGRTFTIPELTVLEVGDLQEMSQEELLLKLAMADIRVVPAQDSSGEVPTPKTTIIHGRRMMGESSDVRNGEEYREMEVKGTKVLYDYHFYPTCALRGRELLVYYPELRARFDFRVMIAAALEKSNLRGEALDEYIRLSAEQLSPSQKSFVEKNTRRLKQQ
jgi:hypothetical protein